MTWSNIKCAEYRVPKCHIISKIQERKVGLSSLYLFDDAFRSRFVAALKVAWDFFFLPFSFSSFLLSLSQKRMRLFSCVPARTGTLFFRTRILHSFRWPLFFFSCVGRMRGSAHGAKCAKCSEYIQHGSNAVLALGNKFHEACFRYHLFARIG